MTTVTRPAIRGTALVTGGTSGIGLAFARALAGRGCDLVLVARDRARLDATAAELRTAHGITVEVISADLSQPDDVRLVARRLEDAAAPVQVFVNNAGHGVHARLVSDDSSEHESAIDLMVRAVLVLGAAAGRAMSGRGSGVIVNVASVAGLVPMGSYSAIKAWVRTWSEGLKVELTGTGVQVMTLMPGWVRTEFHDRAGIRTSSIPNALWLDADRLVGECLDDVEAGRTLSVPSKRWKVVAWLAQHGPRWAVHRATALIKKGRR